MPKLVRPPLVDREDWQEKEKSNEEEEEEKTGDSENGEFSINTVQCLCNWLCYYIRRISTPQSDLYHYLKYIH